jgi:RNA-directed DNA polymerase
VVKDKSGCKIPLYLYRACETPIKRHIKIMSEANPYDPKFKDYFKYRDNTSRTRITLSTKAAG